jgi:ABC-type multidrug transport system permease subunit
MNAQNNNSSSRTSSPVRQLVLSRLREFIREPEVIFWVYGFPVLLTIALGIAFRNKPVEKITVDVEEGPKAQAINSALEGHEKFQPAIHDAETCRLRLRTGKTDLVVRGLESAGAAYEYEYDPTRTESLLARNALDDALQRTLGRKDLFEAERREMTEPGSRYVDFLIPGLLGMSLMGGGLWGVGFVIVDMRIRKLLKRFLATPMKKSTFLIAIMLSRFLFMLPEMVILIVFARFVFGVQIQGSYLAVIFLIVLGACTFSGIGLLVASRARTMETVSGLMNLVMLPMWILSGIFFSPERFPEMVQPVINFLPLTPLIQGLRAVYLENVPLTDLWSQICIMAGWGITTFVLALRWFRWN